MHCLTMFLPLSSALDYALPRASFPNFDLWPHPRPFPSLSYALFCASLSFISFAPLACLSSLCYLCLQPACPTSIYYVLAYAPCRPSLTLILCISCNSLTHLLRLSCASRLSYSSILPFLSSLFHAFSCRMPFILYTFWLHMCLDMCFCPLFLMGFLGWLARASINASSLVYSPQSIQT